MKLLVRMIFLLLAAAILGGCGPRPIVYEGPTPTKEITLRLEDKTCS